MKIFDFFKNLNLDKKLTLSISTLFVMILMVIFTIFRYQYADIIIDKHKEAIHVVAQNIASSAIKSIFIYDYGTIQKNMDEVSGLRDLAYIVVYDKNNKPVAYQVYQEELISGFNNILEEKLTDVKENNFLNKEIEINEHSVDILEIFVPLQYLDQQWGKVRIAVTLDTLNASLNRIELILLIIGFVTIIFVWSGSRYISKMYFVPLQKIIDATRKIAEGDLNFNIEIEKPNEIRELARAFNKMIDDLRSSREKIENWGKELENKVRERTIQLERSEKALLNILMDFKEANEKLKASEQKYRRFFEDDLTGDFISTIDGKLIDCNPAYARIFGYDSVEEIKKENTVSRYSSSDARTEFIELLKREKKLIYYETELKKKDGSTIYVVQNVFGDFDDNGELKYIRGYLFDDTQRKKLEQQLLHVQKMEAIGTLASGVAHDFNNVMGIVLGVLDMIKMKISDPEIDRLVEMGKKAIDRGAGVAKQLLLFSRAEKGKFSLIKLSIIIKEVLLMLKHSFPKNIEIETFLNAKNDDLYADSNQIHMVVLNICVNARDAMPNGGKLVIRTYNVKGEQIQEKFPQANKYEYIVMDIKDTGVGMTKEVMTRIFDPFFTTKEKGKGTGLGLSIIYGIVKAHNAFIDVESEVGVGTTFKIYFPLAEIVPPNLSELKIDQNLKGNETILLVEDEEYLLSTLKNLLVESGYKVLAAKNGFEGLKLYMENKNYIDLVLTDLGLPQMPGDKMFVKMKECNPDVVVIMVTGYIQIEKKSELFKLGIKEILCKPLHFNKILGAIRSTLDSVKNN